MIDSEDNHSDFLYSYFTECITTKNPIGIYQLLIRFLEFVSMENQKNFIPIDDFFKKLNKKDLQDFYEIPIIYNFNPIIVKHYFWFLFEYIKNVRNLNVIIFILVLLSTFISTN